VCSLISGDSVLKVKTLFFTGILLSGLFSECLATSLTQKWAMVTQPTKTGGSTQSIGTYNAGCISGAVSVPATGTGYQMMRLSRNRSFGHPDLKQFIEKLGQTAARQNLGTLLIGDLGQPRGGPTLSGIVVIKAGLMLIFGFCCQNKRQVAPWPTMNAKHGARLQCLQRIRMQ